MLNNCHFLRFASMPSKWLVQRLACIIAFFLKDVALMSISPAGRGQLVKILKTLEPHGIFGSNLAYLYILTLSSHWYAMVTRLRRASVRPVKVF